MRTFSARALRFAHPDFDAADGAPGLRVSPTGGLAAVEGNACVRQAVLLLLSTSPGERVMRPHYGCDLHKLIFEPNDATTAGLAIHYVRRALDRWEPRIVVSKLDAGADPFEPGRLVIDLEYRVRATQWLERLRVAIALDGDAK